MCWCRWLVYGLSVSRMLEEEKSIFVLFWLLAITIPRVGWKNTIFHSAAMLVKWECREWIRTSIFEALQLVWWGIVRIVIYSMIWLSHRYFSRQKRQFSDEKSLLHACRIPDGNLPNGCSDHLDHALCFYIGGNQAPYWPDWQYWHCFVTTSVRHK